MTSFTRYIVALLLCCSFSVAVYAQIGTGVPKPKRSFLGNIIYGIRTSFGKDTTGRSETNTVLNTDALLRYEGKIIRSIRTYQLGFEQNISDSAGNFIYFGTRILNAVHVKSRDYTVRRNIYLKEGTAFNPYLAADNERHLRTLGFIQDSRILIDSTTSTNDSLDLIVVTKDVFAYSPSINGISPLRQRFGLSNNNLFGSGQKVSLSVLHDTRRRENWGLDGGYGYNNIAGSYINAFVNFGRISRNIYDHREDEESLLVQLERPLVSQYKRFAGGLIVGKSKSLNMFPNYYGGDYYRYDYGVIDVWGGYNIGAKKYLADQKLHLKKFLGLRYFNYHFFETPDQVNENTFDQRFNSRQGILASITLFRQYYYKTKFLYGFGITEDIPSGFNISITTGWYKQLDLSRPYIGFEGYRYVVTRKRDLAEVFLRTGGFLYQGSLQDVGFLTGGSFFTRLMKAGRVKVRQYFRASYGTIINRYALNPLRINNTLGLRSFNSDLASGDCRLALRTETSFFLQQKLFGFKLAPFVAGDLVYLTRNIISTDDYGWFYGIGGGLRTRNENLPFGTYEFRALINPRKLAGDNRVKLSIAVNLKFRYNGSYVSKPDIVELNSDVAGDIY